MLPLENRLQVYYYALLGEGTTVFVHDYDCSDTERDITTALLRTNRQVHGEAEPILYQTHTFDFDEHLEEGIALLQSISETACFSIRSVSMVLLH